jgi:hypothetical protein
VCECCHPSAAVAPNGEILVMFRNSIEGSRDMYVVRSSDRGKTFGTAAKQGSGTWKLNACPMDGGGIAAGVSAWRREKDVYVANGSGGETLLGQGRDPAIAVGEAGPYVLWSSAEGLRLARPDGTQRVLDPKGRYASAASSGTVVAVWERDGAIIFDRLD